MKKKTKKLLAILSIMILLTIGSYLLIPKKINIDVFPPRGRDSHIVILLNDKEIFDSVLSANRSLALKSPSNTLIEKSSMGLFFMLTIKEHNNSLTKEVTILMKFVTNVEIHVGEGIDISMNFIRPGYE